ncbi:MAG: TOBE domain-containing protein [Halobacteriaceae archaeon]
MDVDPGFETELDRANVRVRQRDAELLRAIRDQGSLNKAADALGRSYSRSHRRIVELEEAFGTLADRQRGGSGGGGSTLTDTGEGLLAEFGRLDAEFTGLTNVDETVLEGTVLDREGELGTIRTAVGEVRAIVHTDQRDVHVGVRADAITLHESGSLASTATSARNRFDGTVSDLAAGNAIARVTVEVGPEVELATLVTQASVDRLGLAVGESVVLSFKATATRAFGTATAEASASSRP